MIKSDLFYAAFEAGFASQQTSPIITRNRGKIPKYCAAAGKEKVSFWFKVNPKASAMPPLPGVFWPEIKTEQFHANERDNGLVSWYQYASVPMKVEMKRLQWLVFTKFENLTGFKYESWRGVRDAHIPTMRRFIEEDFRPQWPHAHLHYLDQEDAELWGKLFARQLVPWVEKFWADPETLDGSRLQVRVK
jgi:hypothetical protein